jgi:hypothetical protein
MGPRRTPSNGTCPGWMTETGRRPTPRRRARQRRKDGTHTRAGFRDGCLGGRGASPDSKIPLPPVRRALPRIRKGFADGQAGREGSRCPRLQRSQLGNRLARCPRGSKVRCAAASATRRRAPSPGRPLSALSVPGHLCRKDIVVGDDNKSLPEGPRRCIRAASRPGDVVLDPFAGAGTTGLAASKLKQDCVLLDISADYVQMMMERLEGKKHDEAGAAQIEIDSGDPLRHLGLPDDCADRGAGIVPPPQGLPAPDSDAVLGA